MTRRPTYLSDSGVQREAESAILDAVSLAIGCGPLSNGTVNLAEGARVEVDGVDEAGQVFVEAYARQGHLKGAQLKKISQDVLKLALIRRNEGEKVRTVIALASPEAESSIRGWLRFATTTLGVEVLVVEISDEWRDRIEAAQRGQVMVNIEEVADDVDAIELGSEEEGRNV